MSIGMKRIPHVLLVPEDLVDGAGVPFSLARAGEYSVSFKASSNLVHALAFKVFAVDSLYDLRLHRIDDKVPIRVLGVAKETGCG